MDKCIFFKSPFELHKWLKKNHAKARELWIGFYKKNAAKKGITYAEALDEALCFGWIDGIRKGIDDARYTIRYTPRKPKSIWSLVNIRRAGQLKKLGLMQPYGIKAFNERDINRSQLYSFEQRVVKLAPVYEKKFKHNKKAWDYFKSQPSWYQKTASWWVVSAKKEETRLSRLEILIKDSRSNRSIKVLIRKK
ncbi:MAG TPA: YdeI/OmpD-associated family protein [Ignavibacteria bacterium]|jgi:uncharacterized protein YdeI (YjbR/CyaY-like superfamily)